MVGLVECTLDVNESGGGGIAFGEAILDKRDKLVGRSLSGLGFTKSMLPVIEPFVGFGEPR